MLIESSGIDLETRKRPHLEYEGAYYYTLVSIPGHGQKGVIGMNEGPDSGSLLKTAGIVAVASGTKGIKEVT